MLKEINIDGEVFSYEEKNLTYQTIKPMSEDVGRRVLIKTKELFDEIGLDFYLICGTLLGAVRERSFIKGDEDVDVYVRDEKKLYKNLPFLQNHELKLIRLVKGCVYSFCLNDDAYIDVYILKPIRNMTFYPWAIYCYSIGGKIVPKRFFNNTQNIEFLGLSLKCPKDPEKILQFYYGENWRTPVRGHKFFYEVPSAHYWRIFVHNCKEFAKGLLGKEVNYWHR